MKTRIDLLVVLGLATAAAVGGTVTIENRQLSVSYDSAVHEFAVTDRATRKTVLANSKLLNAPVTRAQSLAAADPVFGKGRQIRVTYADGAVS